MSISGNLMARMADSIRKLARLELPKAGAYTQQGLIRVPYRRRRRVNKTIVHLTLEVTTDKMAHGFVEANPNYRKEDLVKLQRSSLDLRWPYS